MTDPVPEFSCLLTSVAKADLLELEISSLTVLTSLFLHLQQLALSSYLN